MSKIAFVFPGQGSQTVGMCKDLYDNYTCARKVFEAADEALGFSISDMCFNGPEDQLRLTFNTQPAITPYVMPTPTPMRIPFLIRLRFPAPRFWLAKTDAPVAKAS